MHSSPSDEEHFYQVIPSKGALYFICIVLILFGALLTTTLLRTGVGADEIVTAFIGLVFGLVGFRLWWISWKPMVVISTEVFMTRQFLCTRSWSMSEIASIASFQTIVQGRNARGRKMPPTPVHFLGIKTMKGRVTRVVLPAVRGNDRILSTLARCSLIPITSINDDEAYASWKRAPAE